MNKKDLINEIAASSMTYYSAGLSKAQIDAVFDTLAEVAKRHLVRPGAELTLPGIGKLKAVAKAERIGRNPKTGEEVQIPAHTAVKLTVAKELKDAVA